VMLYDVEVGVDLFLKGGLSSHYEDILSLVLNERCFWDNEEV